MSEPKKDETFINRHGRRLGVTTAELSELSIDEAPKIETDAEEVATSRSKATKHKKSPKTTPQVAVTKDPSHARRRLHFTRKTKLVMGAIVIVLIAIPIITGEALRAQYVGSAASAKEDFKRLVNTDVRPQQKSAELTSKQLLVTITKLETIRDAMCPGALWDNVATLYTRAQTAHSACIAERGRIASLSTQLRTLQKELAYAEFIDTALTQVTAPSTDAFAVISAQQDNWKQAQEKIAKITPPSELVAAHLQLTTAARTIVDGWSQLNIANNEQNTDNFAAAEKQLGEGYDAVRASKELFANKMIAQQNVITVTAQKITK